MKFGILHAPGEKIAILRDWTILFLKIKNSNNTIPVHGFRTKILYTQTANIIAQFATIVESECTLLLITHAVLYNSRNEYIIISGARRNLKREE